MDAHKTTEPWPCPAQFLCAVFVVAPFGFSGEVMPKYKEKEGASLPTNPGFYIVFALIAIVLCAAGFFTGAIYRKKIAEKEIGSAEEEATRILLVADLALEADLLVLAAVALPVLGRSKDTLAEQAIAFRLERTVVNGFGLLYLAVRPLADQLGRSQTDLNGVKRMISHIF